MSISGDSWHKVSSEAGAEAEAEAEAPADSASLDQTSLQVQPRPEQLKQKQQSHPELVVSSANVQEEEGTAGILLRIRGGCMLFFVIAVWVFGVSQGRICWRGWGINREFYFHGFRVEEGLVSDL